MGIKRYTAIADNTITNQYNEALKTRATKSNVGLADSLEIFKIYGQVTSTTTEQSRILIKFPVNETDLPSDVRTILQDRTAGTIPASGSVKFVMKLSNVRHSDTVPNNFKIVAHPVSQAWTEGLGIDMDEYSDIGQSSWLSASSATAWISAGSDYLTDYVYEQQFDTGFEDFEVDVSEYVEGVLKDGHTLYNKNYGFAVLLSSSFISDTNSYYTKKFSARTSEYFFQRPIIEAQWDSSVKDDRRNFYYSSSLAPAEDNLNTIYLYNNIGGKLKNIPGIGTGSIYVQLFLSSDSSPTGSALVPVEDGTYVRSGAPTVVTGGYVSTGIYSASVAMTGTAETLHDVWYNQVKASTVLTFGSGIPSNGTLGITFGALGAYTLTFDNTAGSTDASIGSDKAATIDPSAESDSAGNAQRVLLLLRDGVTGDAIKNAYDFAYDGSSAGSETVTITSKEDGTTHNITVTESLSNISSTVTAASLTNYHTGTIYPETRTLEQSTRTNDYYVSLTNLKTIYSNTETARIRIYSRLKGWSPTIYTKAVSEPQLYIPTSGSYEIIRIIDNYKVVEHSTGSTKFTELSFDGSGSYFDFDMSMLEPGYSYGIKLAFYDDFISDYKPLKETFKFRVEKHET